MSDHEDDIDFNFFEEPEPEPPRRGLVRRTVVASSGPGRPRPAAGPAAPAAPLLRLVLLVAIAIVLIMIFVFAIRSCGGSSKSAYNDYFNAAGAVAQTSQSVGTQLNALLTQPDLNESKLESGFVPIIQQQKKALDDAQKLTPPGPMRGPNQGIVDAMLLRLNGVQGMLAAFQQTASSRDSTAAGKQLAKAASALLASDVVWTQLFVDPAQSVMKTQGVVGAGEPPGSVFLSNSAFASQDTLTLTWRRLHGTAPTGGAGSGLHGTAIAGIKALPTGTVISSGGKYTLKVTRSLGFAVSVTDSGAYQEVNVQVTLAISQTGFAPVKRTIPVINPGQTKVVEFDNLNISTFAQPLALHVDVKPVKNEKTLSNNTASATVTFSYA
ncbi:MAG: hypothetical protein ACXVZW_05155 [Gaiellaceae bacterium]